MDKGPQGMPGWTAHGCWIAGLHAWGAPIHAGRGMVTSADPRIAAAARALCGARRTRRPIPVLTAHWPDLDEAQAYAIARATQALLGESRVGYKLGYTSAAMRAQMGVEQPNYGVLTAPGRTEHGGVIATGDLIHPLVEPEIAFVMGAEVRDAVGLARAVASIHPALEIVDTRYEAYRFKACDNIADNSSAARFVIGPALAEGSGGNLARMQVVLLGDECELDRGLGAAAMEDPWNALRWLAQRLIAEGSALRPGDVVLTGGLTRAHPARAGMSFCARLGDAGEVRVRFG